ncbi:hypothetical protein [Acidisoma cladoniae]|jgi:hypothetical protein|uniref:hypothetical protein n=1 Tax=Acidisoma cladoniae TaxID=3040935 RepID=UPI00254C3A4E|nr:hypothetical protein [Acidisoma sp. PAMC 29798]
MPKAKKIVIGAAVVVVLVVAGAGGAQVWAQNEARTRLDAMLAKLPTGVTGRYTNVQYNLFTSTLRLDGLVITQDGKPTVAIDQTVLHHVSGDGTQANPYRADRLRMVGMTSHHDAHTLKVATFEAQAIALLAPGVPAPDGTPAWLVTPYGTPLSGDTAVANGLADDEGDTLATVSAVGYHAGHLDNVVAADFEDTEGHRIAAASGSAIDLDGLDRVFNAARYTPGAPTWPNPRPLIGHAEISGIVEQSKGGTGDTLGRLSMDAFAARPFASSPTDAHADTIDFWYDAASAISLGSVHLSGLSGTTTGPKSVVALNDLVAKTYTAGTLASFSFDGLSLSGSDGEKATFGHFDLNGLNLASLLHNPTTGSLWSAMTAADDGSLRLDTLHLSNLTVTPKEGGTVKLDSLSEAVSAGSPVLTTVTMRGLAIPADTLSLASKPLKSMGVDTLTLDLDEALTFDPVSDTATIQQAKLTARTLGTVTLAGKLANLPKGKGMTSADEMLAALTKIAVASFQVSFTNDTLVQRLIALQASESGKTTADVISMAKLGASFVASTLVPDQADAGEQISAFIDNPKTVTITATPAVPVPLADFEGQQLTESQKALNLHLTAE